MKQKVKTMDYQTLQFVKLGKVYKSKHGGEWFHIYFKNSHTGKSYRTTLYSNMRNFKNWRRVISKAFRGDVITNLQLKKYKNQMIVDADSRPFHYTADEYYQKENERFNSFYGVDWA